MTPRQPTPRHRRTSRDILEAAAHRLAEQPDASLDEVAEAAGVGRATLFRHFPSRDALLAALRDEAIEEVGRRFDEAALEDVPVAEAIGRIVRATLIVGDRYSILMREQPRPGEHRPSEEVRGPIRAVIERGIREGLTDGRVPPEALLELFSSVLAAGIRLVSERTASMEDAAAWTTAFAVRAVLSADGAPSQPAPSAP